MDKDKVLADIFNDDPDGILDVRVKSAGRSADDRLIAAFEEINTYYEQHQREPEPSTDDISEHKLYSRLRGLREDGNKMMELEPYDRYGLLTPVQKEFNSLEDIFSDDSGDILLGKDDHGLFEFKHIPRQVDMPDYIATRNKCRDFDQFEELFLNCHADLRCGNRQLTKFKNEQQIDKGYFFVLKGVLLYVAEVGVRTLDKNKKMNARLRVIFENGTESDLLLRSLSAELYKDGRRVTEHVDKYLDPLVNIDSEDKEAGYIFVLQSKSENPDIASVEHLYKIGYTAVAVEERIKNAVNEPTYLMAEVDIVGVWKCWNMNPQKFEQLLHTFFGHVCLDIDIYDSVGMRHTPREWFVVPRDVINQAISLIISGEVVDYIYDEQTELIKRR